MNTPNVTTARQNTRLKPSQVPQGRTKLIETGPLSNPPSHFDERFTESAGCHLLENLSCVL